MPKLKVAVVIPTHANLKSSLHNLLKVYEYLIKKFGFEVTIFIDKKHDFSYKNFKIQKISSLDHGNMLEKLFLVLGLQRDYYLDLIGKLKGYDIIETSNPEFYWFAYQSYLAAKKYNSRLILRTSQTVEGFYLFRFTKFIPINIVKKAYKHARYLLFTNPEAADRCIRLGLAEKNSKKIVVIGHATDTNTFRPLNLKKQKNKAILLSVGGLYEIKGHHLIIRALRKVIDKRNNTELWIVGDGYYKNELVRLAKNLGLENNVKFLGSKEHDELANIYNKADIFVLANYQEITPAVNEALACSIPVVVMECGGREFVIPNESCGLVSKKFDSDDMAEKIISLIKNKGLAEKIAKNGRKRTLDKFSIEKVAEKFYKAFTG
ncbi:glycosyltransferase family 4 protein [Candidatus Woesearchaeota archaeon]|nr:glycosyltransferase family 4 protein [Candidatus Woesearchaeota archaeon]